MFLIRDIFIAKPGKVKNLVEIFKATSPYFLSKGAKNIRVLTDTVSSFWTVVWEFEVDEIGDYFEMSKNVNEDPEVYGELEGYKDYVQEGRREIFEIHE
jgi:hypothetical protein